MVAAPAPLPAAELEPGTRVAWALLHAGGAVTLVSHDGAPPLVRLSWDTARLEAGPLGARWVGGAELPLLPTPDRRDPVAPRPPPPPGSAAGLLQTAAALRTAVRRGAVDAEAWPWPADLGDLQVVARVLEALRTSARTETLVRVA